MSVIVKEAFKAYKSDGNILNGLNLSVESGSIYALVGASGCGKTTLLSAIVGQRYLDRGDIFVLGEQLKPCQLPKCCLQIGFMPQETALHDEFTVNETLYFFGNILQMDSDLLRERAEMLKKLLELPSDDRKVQDCSGGQKRRISLAAAMIHDPKLLILDEPTVGLDPILRETFWNYLLDISRNGNVAIILSTHYIDEAKRADCCGMMRNGVLVAQDSPEMILEKTNCENLDESFLKLCCSSASIELNENDVLLEQMDVVESSDAKKERKNFHLTTMKALMFKSYVQVIRQPGTLFTILCCFASVSLFEIAFGRNPRDLKIGIVSEEFSNYHQDCLNVSSFKSSQTSCDLKLLSCRFIDEISDDVGMKIFYQNFTAAFKDLNNRNLIAVINFSSKFTNSTQRVLENDFNDKDLDDREIKIWIDRSDYQTSFYLKNKLYEIYENFSKSLMNGCNWKKMNAVPIRFEKPIYGSLEFNLSQHATPLYFLSVLLFTVAAAVGSNLVDDRFNKTWTRTILNGVGAFEIMFSHFVVHFVIMLITLFMLISIMLLFYPHIILVRIMPTIMIFGMTGITGIFCGITFGCLVNDYISAGYVYNFISTTIFYGSGLIWPLESVPKFMRFLMKYLLIVNIPIESVRDNIEKDYGVTKSSIVSGIVSLTTWSAVFIIVSWFILKRIKFS